MSPSVKVCSKCDATKDLDQFKPHTKNGTRPECRECTRAYNAEWRERNRETITARQAGWYQANRERVLAEQRATYPARRELVAERSASWYAANRERALVWASEYKLRRFGITRSDLERLLNMQGGVCAICASPPADDSRLRVDHDHACCPPRRGCHSCLRGLLCNTCNLHEGRVNPDAWAEYIARPRPLLRTTA